MGLDYCFDPSEVEEAFRANPDRFPAAWTFSPDDNLAPEALSRIATALRRNGWSDAEVAMAMGGNLRRVAAKAWKPVSGGGGALDA